MAAQSSTQNVKGSKPGLEVVSIDTNDGLKQRWIKQGKRATRTKRPEYFLQRKRAYLNKLGWIYGNEKTCEIYTRTS